MGGDHHKHLSRGRSKKDHHDLPPKGWMAIRVGEEGGETQRFFVPVQYLNHPLFARLLKEAEDVYGFDQKGAITIPCHVEHFRRVQDIINRDCSAAGGHHHGGHHHGSHHHLHLHLAGCFRA